MHFHSFRERESEFWWYDYEVSWISFKLGINELKVMWFKSVSDEIEVVGLGVESESVFESLCFSDYITLETFVELVGLLNTFEWVNQVVFPSLQLTK